jgi:hypothetical protein
MKSFSGRNLFPDQNQIYRIRNTVKYIFNEVCTKFNKQLTYQEFCDYINPELMMHSYFNDDQFNPALISRLMQFGKNSTAANSLKILEHLPLLHVVSGKYSKEDLQRIALGQPIKSNDEVNISIEKLHDIKRTLLEAVALIDIIDQPVVSTVMYDASLSEEDKFKIYKEIINHGSNMSWLTGTGIVTAKDIAEYNTNEQVPDHIFIYMLSNCQIPNTVRCFFKQHLMNVQE